MTLSKRNHREQNKNKNAVSNEKSSYRAKRIHKGRGIRDEILSRILCTYSHLFLSKFRMGRKITPFGSELILTKEGIEGQINEWVAKIPRASMGRKP